MSDTTPKLDWRLIQRTIYQINKNVCGHSLFGYIVTLLERIELISEDDAKYLADVKSLCTKCQSTAKPKPSRIVSLSSLNRSFNDVVCMYHFFLDGLSFFAMDATTRYSVALICRNTLAETASHAIGTFWLGPFRPLAKIRGDDALRNNPFLTL